MFLWWSIFSDNKGSISPECKRYIYCSWGYVLLYAVLLHGDPFCIFFLSGTLSWLGSHMFIFFSCCYVTDQQHWSSKQIEKREHATDWVTLKLSRVFGVRSVKSLKNRHVWSEIGSGFQQSRMVPYNPSNWAKTSSIIIIPHIEIPNTVSIVDFMLLAFVHLPERTKSSTVSCCSVWFL